MTRPEASVLIARLMESIDRLQDAAKDLRECPGVPEHVLDAVRFPVSVTEEAARELGKIFEIRA